MDSNSSITSIIIVFRNKERVKKISEIHNNVEEIIIKNKDILNKKILELKRSGKEDLHIIADFDKTITKAFIDGKKFQSTIALVRQDNYLGEEYIGKAHQLFDKYHPYEVDNTLALDEKNKMMNEWWAKHLELMIKSGLNKKVILDIVNKKSIKLRDGTKELLETLAQNKIPLLIFSAGLGDIIKEHLKSIGNLYENIHIISNFFNFDSEGNVTGYHKKIIHSSNKNEVVIKNEPYNKEITNRKNVILLGDSIGDLGMSAGIDHENIIKIGFLNEEVEKDLEQYSNNFDIVILNDGSMEYINTLIKNVIHQ